MARWEKKDQDLYMKAGDNHMKNKLFLMIMVIMVCSLTACGQQETGTMTT